MKLGKRRILLLGAAGNIGGALWRNLKDKYDIIPFDKQRIAGEAGAIVGDITSMDDVLPACQGVDTVLHMDGLPGGDDFEELLDVNIRGSYIVYEAARRAGCRRVVFASSNHASGGWMLRSHMHVLPEMPARPDSLYGASKSVSEEMGFYYADRTPLSVHCLRIGHHSRDDSPKVGGNGPWVWISHRDMAQLTVRCIEDEEFKFGTFNAASDNPRTYLDTDGARELLGYRPQDSTGRHEDVCDPGLLKVWREFSFEYPSPRQNLSVVFNDEVKTNPLVVPPQVEQRERRVKSAAHSGSGKRRIMITGAAGTVGTALRNYLDRERYEIVCLDIRPIPEEPNSIVADITKKDEMIEAIRDVDTVIHLAGKASGDEFERLLDLNYRGTYHVLEAARQNGIRQVIYASSCCASLRWAGRSDVYTTADLPLRPDSLYGASKGYGEHLGRIYADYHDLPVVCLRIGHCRAGESAASGLSDLFCWISHRDMAQITSLCIERDDIHFAVFYATSHAPKPCLDIEPAKQILGYRPQDSIEPFLASYPEEILERYRKLECRRIDRTRNLAILRYDEFGRSYW